MAAYYIVNNSDLSDRFVLGIISDILEFDVEQGTEYKLNEYMVRLEYFHNQYKYWFLAKKTIRMLAFKVHKSCSKTAKIEFI